MDESPVVGQEAPAAGEPAATVLVENESSATVYVVVGEGTRTAVLGTSDVPSSSSISAGALGVAA